MFTQYCWGSFQNPVIIFVKNKKYSSRMGTTDDDSHPELVVDSDEEDESSSTERARTFASLSDTGHPEPAVARAPGPIEHLDVAARALVCAEGRALERQLASTAAAAAPATTASASVGFPQGVLETDPTKSEQDIGDFKMRLRLRIAADPEAFFALADTTQDDSLSPEE